MEHRATIFGLGDNQRARALRVRRGGDRRAAGDEPPVERGRAGRADLVRAAVARGVGDLPRVAGVLRVLSSARPPRVFLAHSRLVPCRPSGGGWRACTVSAPRAPRAPSLPPRRRATLRAPRGQAAVELVARAAAGRRPFRRAVAARGVRAHGVVARPPPPTPPRAPRRSGCRRAGGARPPAGPLERGLRLRASHRRPGEGHRPRPLLVRAPARHDLRRRPFHAAAMRRADGQSTVEVIGLLPLLLAVGLGVFALLSAGAAREAAGGAAEAGAVALLQGRDARAAARAALPGWPRAARGSPSPAAASRSRSPRAGRSGPASAPPRARTQVPHPRLHPCDPDGRRAARRAVRR